MAQTKTLMGLGVPGALATAIGEIKGSFTLNGATPVTVTQSNLGSEHQIIMCRETVAGTPGWYDITTRTNGTGFAVTGTAGDTSVIRYTLKDFR